VHVFIGSISILCLKKNRNDRVAAVERASNHRANGFASDRSWNEKRNRIKLRACRLYFFSEATSRIHSLPADRRMKSGGSWVTYQTKLCCCRLGQEGLAPTVAFCYARASPRPLRRTHGPARRESKKTPANNLNLVVKRCARARNLSIDGMARALAACGRRASKKQPISLTTNFLYSS
jgi:hypothetical protein